jgi:hypothetical protein
MNIKIYSDKRGDLSVVDFSELPFVPARMFYIQNVPECDNERGDHAHKWSKQFYICIKGTIRIKVWIGEFPKTIVLNDNDYLFVDKMVWTSEIFDNENAILLVLSNMPYLKEDYITDFNEYIRLTS